MAAKTAGKPAAKKAAPKAKPAAKKKAAAPAKAAESKAPEKKSEPKGPAVVKDFELVTGDAHAVLTINGTDYRFDPEQVETLRRRVTVAFVELH